MSALLLINMYISLKAFHNNYIFFKTNAATPPIFTGLVALFAPHCHGNPVVTEIFASISKFVNGTKNYFSIMLKYDFNYPGISRFLNSIIVKVTNY